MSKIECKNFIIIFLSLFHFISALSNYEYYHLQAASFEKNSSVLLSRKKRYLAFPEGSSVSASLCTTIGSIGNPDVDFLSYALNWGIAYDLPNDTWVKQVANGFPKNPTKMYKAEKQRRNRREFYHKLELAIDSIGFDGHQCILRALCESAQYFAMLEKGDMIEELVRTVFTFPKERVLSREHRDIHEYDRAYRKGKSTVNCSLKYPGCTFSLIELAFGKYSEPPQGYYDDDDDDGGDEQYDNDDNEEDYANELTKNISLI